MTIMSDVTFRVNSNHSSEKICFNYFQFLFSILFQWKTFTLLLMYLYISAGVFAKKKYKCKVKNSLFRIESTNEDKNVKDDFSIIGF